MPNPSPDNGWPTSGAPGAPTPAGKLGLRPTLFLGIGGLAAAALRRLKKRLHAAHGGPAGAPIFRLLLVDTDREELRRARQGNPAEALTPAETFLASLHLPDYYRPQLPKLCWLDRRWLFGIQRSLLTEGLRPLGRLALLDNTGTLLPTLRDTLAAITSADAIAETTQAAGAALRDHTPRVFVVASVAGGTGGGMVLDMAYALRQVLAELGLYAHGLCGMLLHATSAKPVDQETARVNTYATLTELDHFSRPGIAYPGDPNYGLRPGEASQAPFEETYLVHLGEQLGLADVQAATEVLADYLLLDASPHGGGFLDPFRQQTRATPRDRDEPCLVRSFGLARVATPGARPPDVAAGALCRRMAERWLAGPGESETQYVERCALRQAGACGLDEAPLVAWRQTALAGVLGGAPDVYLLRVRARAAAVAGSERPAMLLGPIDQEFGVGASPGEGPVDNRSSLRALLRQAAEQRGAELGRTLRAWLVQLVETPGKRFKAAARAAVVLAREVTILTEDIDARLAEVVAQRQALRRQLAGERMTSVSSALGWLGRTLGGAPKAGDDDLRAYIRLWLQETAESSVLALLDVVGKELDTLLNEVVQGRQRLEKFAALLPPAPNEPTAPPPVSAAAGEDGKPEPAGDDRAALLTFRFDRSCQYDVLERYGGLWGVFVPSGEPGSKTAGAARLTLEALAQECLARANCAIRGTVPDLGAAERFLQRHGGPEQALPALRARAEAARPQLQASAAEEHLLLALPDGPAGQALGQMIASVLPDVPVTMVHTSDEILLCHEVRCPLPEVVRALIGPAEVPVELVRGVMTRLDVPWPLPEASAVYGTTCFSAAQPTSAAISSDPGQTIAR